MLYFWVKKSTGEKEYKGNCRKIMKEINGNRYEKSFDNRSE